MYHPLVVFLILNPPLFVGVVMYIYTFGMIIRPPQQNVCEDEKYKSQHYAIADFFFALISVDFEIPVISAT